MSAYGPDYSQQALLPHPTLALATPPLGEGEIQLNLPDSFADVWFDGVKTSSLGDTRYYVTPPLQSGKEYEYDVKIRWKRGDEPVTAERKVSVRSGQKTVVDFTKKGPAE
jgi:uncharacterized protein (TIGR03000 family)